MYQVIKRDGKLTDFNLTKIAEAITKAYSMVDKIKFDNAYFRKDIGQRALKAKECK